MPSNNLIRTFLFLTTNVLWVTCCPLCSDFPSCPHQQNVIMAQSFAAVSAGSWVKLKAPWCCLPEAQELPYSQQGWTDTSFPTAPAFISCQTLPPCKAHPVSTVCSIHWHPGQIQSLVGSCIAPEGEGHQFKLNPVCACLRIATL